MNGQKSRARETILLSQVQVLGLVVIKSVLVVKVNLCQTIDKLSEIDKFQSKLKAGKCNFKVFLHLSHPSQKCYCQNTK